MNEKELNEFVFKEYRNENQPIFVHIFLNSNLLGMKIT